MKVILAVLAMLLGAATAMVIAGSSRWHRASAERVALLAPAGDEATSDDRSIEALPAPAARYFRRVLRDGQRLVTSAVATQEAEFFINGAWRPLTATQQFVTSPPGFVWDARITMAPLVKAYVRDSYVRGNASMTASVLGAYPLVDQNGAPELNSGALQRWLGEAIWFPTALLPSQRIAWAPRDERSAIVTLRDSGIEVSLTFEIDADGNPIAITGDRFKESGGRYTMQPWRIRCDELRDRGGMMIPLHCEASWITNGVPEPYWRGRIASITYRYNQSSRIE